MITSFFPRATRMLFMLAVVVGGGGFILFGSLVAVHAEAGSDDDFVTMWRATQSDLTITIPVTGSTGSYSIDWGDGSTDTYNGTGDRSHTYASAGEYPVLISGDITAINLGGDRANARQLLSIGQWGDIQWSSMESAFAGASNMAYRAIDSPDLSGVSDASRMFYNAYRFNADLSGWNTSSVIDMSGMFSNADAFTGKGLSSWDVSGVTDMSDMFRYTPAFNGDLSEWDTSSVTDMSGMFNNAHTFNSDLSGWNTSSVTYMGGMFDGATSFTGGGLSSWDVSSVTDMTNMFTASASFNSDLSSWDVSSVTDMSGMFSHARAFNSDLSGWDTSSVTSMRYMFYSAASFNSDLSGWDTSSVTGTSNMFQGATSFTGKGLSSWDVSGVTSMSNMFQGASSFRQNLGPWYVTLNETRIYDGSFAAAIGAQNPALQGHNPTYSLVEGAGCTDNSGFAMSGGVLTIRSAPTQDAYSICIGASGGGLFGTGNVRQVALHANPPPTADAGSDQTVSEGSTVTLDGSGSSDPDGETISYSWTAPAGITLQNAETASPSFTAPSVSADTDYAITLTVSDGSDSATDTVTITVQNVNGLPTADAGSDQTVSEGSTVTLDGSGSSDPDGETISYSWTAPAGITLQNAETASPSFTAPSVSADTDYAITLTVSDGSDSATDTVTITVQNVNGLPTADAGSDQTVSEGSTVTLDGSGSSDPDGETISYSWTAPAGITLQNAETASPSFTAPSVSADTDYAITLTVSDGSDSATDTVTITVQDMSPPPIDTTPPAAPTNLQATSTTNRPPSDQEHRNPDLGRPRR